MLIGMAGGSSWDTGVTGMGEVFNGLVGVVVVIVEVMTGDKEATVLVGVLTLGCF